MDIKNAKEISELKNTIIKVRKMLIVAEKKASMSDVTVNGLYDVIDKLIEFEIRLDLRQRRAKRQ